MPHSPLQMLLWWLSLSLFAGQTSSVTAAAAAAATRRLTDITLATTFHLTLAFKLNDVNFLRHDARVRLACFTVHFNFFPQKFLGCFAGAATESVYIISYWLY